MHAETVSMHDLEEALQIAAEVVALHGEKYLPYFERLDREYQERLRQGSTLERARLMAARRQHQIPGQLSL